jgi:hypothetical protein
MRHALIITVMLLAGCATATAEECRIKDSIVKSAASLKANTTAGGHVSIHVKGQPTEAGKSQFDSEKVFVGAFKAWEKMAKPKPEPKECQVKPPNVKDCVPASELKITTAWECTAVGKDGKCTKDGLKKITPKTVGFWYANTKESKGKWILNTAYPSVNEDCM